MKWNSYINFSCDSATTQSGEHDKRMKHKKKAK